MTPCAQFWFAAIAGVTLMRTFLVPARADEGGASNTESAAESFKNFVESPPAILKVIFRQRTRPIEGAPTAVGVTFASFDAAQTFLGRYQNGDLFLRLISGRDEAGIENGGSILISRLGRNHWAFLGGNRIDYWYDEAAGPSGDTALPPKNWTRFLGSETREL